MSLSEELAQAVINGEVARTRQLTQEAVAAGLSPMTLFSDVLSPAMEEVGGRMQRGEFYIPEVLMAAKAMKGAAEILKPLIVRSERSDARGKVLIGTAKGDLHDIGKNLVILLLEGAGFEVIDLGTDVPAPRFVDAVREHQPDILGISALLTTTMLQMRQVLQGLDGAGLRSGLRVMVGGAPVNQRFADEIGADGFGPDAAAAVDLAKAWMSVRQGGLS